MLDCYKVFIDATRFIIFILLIQKEIQNLEVERRRLVRGFREVIDLISTSQRPVVVHNSLNGLSLL